MTTQTPTIDQVRAAWNRIAPRFDQFITPMTTRHAEMILDRIDLQSGTRLLDVGCGSGALAIPAAHRGADVMAVDIAPRMIDLLGARTHAQGIRVDGRVMDAHHLDLPDDRFDATVSQNGVTMSPHLAVALTEIVRVTRPGGTVLVAAFGPLPQVEFLSTFIAGVRAAVPEFTGPPMDPPPPPFQVADPEIFARALAGAGLRDIGIDTMVWDVPVGSATDLWNEVTSSNPIGGQLVADLNNQQRTEVLNVLDGVLRERFGGRPDGTLHAAINIGTGTK